MFLASPADIAIYGGAAGGGKSFGLLLEALRHIKNPRYGAVVFRRTFTEVMKEGGLWDECKELYPLAGARGSRSEMLWTFPSKAKISFGHLDTDNDVYRWQGAQIANISFDELPHFSAFQFWYMFSRNRSICGIRPYIRGTCNPDVNSWVAELIAWWIEQDPDSPLYGYPIPDRAGVIRWFVRMGNDLHWSDDPKELVDRFGGDASPKSFTFIPASVYDNQILLRKDPGYLANLKALPLVERERLLKGNWKIRATAGTRFKREWFKIVKAAPSGLRVVRYWDRAATEPNSSNPDPDWTAGVKIGVSPDGQYYVLNVSRFRVTPGQVRTGIRNVATQDGTGVRIGLEQEPGASGKSEVQDVIKVLAGFSAKAYPAQGDKLTRSGPFSAQCEAGNVFLVEGDWNQAYIDELVNFSGDNKGHDDQVDGSSGAFEMLTSSRGLWIS